MDKELQKKHLSKLVKSDLNDDAVKKVLDKRLIKMKEVCQ